MKAMWRPLRFSISVALVMAGLALLTLGIGGIVARQPSPRLIDARCLEPGREAPCPDDSLGIRISFITPTPTAAAETITLPDPSATPVSVATTADAIGRMIIAKAGTDAPIVVKGIDANNAMEAPDSPYEVAWYDFSARPGQKGNAVFSAHVDWYPNIMGAFWGLRNLEKGDVIRVVLADGSEYRYRVTENYLVNADNAPVAEILGATAGETITLITCDGTFVRDENGYGSYLARRIVRAERIFT